MGLWVQTCGSLPMEGWGWGALRALPTQTALGFWFLEGMEAVVGRWLFCRYSSSPTPSALLVRSLSKTLSVVLWGCPGVVGRAVRQCWHQCVLLQSCRASVPSAIRVAGCCTPWWPRCKPQCSRARPYIGNYLGSLCTMFGTQQLQGEEDIWVAAGGGFCCSPLWLGLGFPYRFTLPPPIGMLEARFPATQLPFLSPTFQAHPGYKLKQFHVSHPQSTSGRRMAALIVLRFD